MPPMNVPLQTGFLLLVTKINKDVGWYMVTQDPRGCSLIKRSLHQITETSHLLAEKPFVY